MELYCAGSYKSQEGEVIVEREKEEEKDIDGG